MKASRHNGRSGKHGSYNPKHNDREFDPEHSEHIDQERMLKNIYWDYENGIRTQAESMQKEHLTFEEVELKFYEEHYAGYVTAQNERNIKNGHRERNRTVYDLYKDPKKCPEESVLQIGNIDGAVSSELLLEAVEEFLRVFEERYGEHVHVLDWSLHVDEQTPHIHERHVFDAINRYGELETLQDRALELLGFELPYPDKPKSRTNNRKIPFDATLRELFLDICEAYGVPVEREASYGGRSYMEKQDFIIANQKRRLSNTNLEIEEKEEELKEIKEDLKDKQKALDAATVELKAVDVLFDNLAEVAYEESCNIIIDQAVEETADSCIENAQLIANDSSLNGMYVSSSERMYTKSAVQKVVERIKKKLVDIANWVKFTFTESAEKKSYVEQVKERMLGRLEEMARGRSVDKDEDVNKKTQELAEQIAVRRRRGR